jgi:hypothetical protein
MRAATRMPVPVAVSQLRVKTAGSNVGLATTGGTRWMRLFKPGTLNLRVVIAFIDFERGGIPQTKTTAERMSQGIQALKTLAEEWS